MILQMEVAYLGSKPPHVPVPEYVNLILSFRPKVTC